MDTTIIRTAKNKDNPYFMMNKTALNDDRLSFKAKGILAYLLSKPDDWQTRVTDLVRRAKDGEDAVRSGLKELAKFGYAKIEQVRDEETGKYKPGMYTIYEIPHGGFPHVDKPDVENRQDTKNDLTKSVETDVSTSDEPEVVEKEKPPKPLEPQTEAELLLFRKLGEEYAAKGRRSPKQFPTLECKDRYAKAAKRLDGRLEEAIRDGLAAGAVATARLVSYVCKWKGVKPKTGYTRQRRKSNFEQTWENLMGEELQQ